MCLEDGRDVAYFAANIEETRGTECDMPQAESSKSAGKKWREEATPFFDIRAYPIYLQVSYECLSFGQSIVPSADERICLGQEEAMDGFLNVCYPCVHERLKYVT